MRNDKLVNQLQKVSVTVKQDFAKKGLVLPQKTDKGLQIGRYLVSKVGYSYCVTNPLGDILYDNINMVQTAILVANALALGRIVRNEWLENDRTVASTEFDVMVFEKQFKKAVTQKDSFGVSHYSTRMSEAKRRYLSSMDKLNVDYQRLVRILNQK